MNVLEGAGCLRVCHSDLVFLPVKFVFTDFYKSVV